MDNWFETLNYKIELTKTKVSSFDELVAELEKMKYVVSYPDTLKRIYWSDDNE